MVRRRRASDIEITGYVEKPDENQINEPDQFVLDPHDEFEAALIDMAKMNRRKRRDYALDGDIFSNFVTTSAWAGFKYAWESALFNCAQKLERVKSLRQNGRLDDPENESVADTVLDNAVYAAIAYADVKVQRSIAAIKAEQDYIARSHAFPSAMFQTTDVVGPMETKNASAEQTRIEP